MSQAPAPDDFGAAVQAQFERAARLEVERTGGTGTPEMHGLSPAAWQQFEALAQLSSFEVPPALKRAREAAMRAGELMDPESRLGERMRGVVARRFALPPTPFVPGDRPPLYEAAADGEWIFHGDAYTAEEQNRWLEWELHRSAADPAYFCTHYVFTQNLHLGAGAATIDPIPDWPYVRETIGAFFPARDVLIEKSRDMIVSWLAMAAVLHDLLFQWNWPIMTLSALEDLVDDGGERSTVDTLHGKVRFMYVHLPRAFREGVPLAFSHLKIAHQAANTHVKGFSATPDAGRGPKWKRAVCDEFAKVPWSEQVMMAITAACPKGKALISTPRGKANAFSRIRHTASRQVYPIPARLDAHEIGCHWERFRIHWSLHPERDRAWFEAMCAEGSLTEEQIAQEWEIDYNKSIGRRVYPAYREELHVAGGIQAAASECVYQPGRPIYLTCDFNHDPLVWLIFQTVDASPRFRAIGEICLRDAIVDDGVMAFIVRYGSAEAVARLEDANPDDAAKHARGGRLLAGTAGHLWPIVLTGDKSEQKLQVYTRTKAYDHMKHLLVTLGGFDVRVRLPEQNPRVEHRLRISNDVLRKRLLLIAPECEQLRKDYQEGVWNTQETDMAQGKDDDGTGLTRSHASSAAGYLFCQLHKLGGAAVPMAQARPRPSLKDMIPQLARW